MPDHLYAREANGGSVVCPENQAWRLELPLTSDRRYTLAQLDDYMHLARRKFPHQPPIRLELEARISGEGIPGTWGFGFWNDPFSFGFGPAGISRGIPILPNAAWFFYGSEQNYLSLTDHQPANGFHAKVFRSSRWPSFLSVLALPVLPFFLWPAAGKVIRKIAKQFVKEDGRSVSVRVEEWHSYRLVWGSDEVRFGIDGQEVFTTPLCPTGKLGLVIWIDNQFMRFGPDGKFRSGYAVTDSTHWMNIRNLKLISQ